jgi:four helix bundle protein
VKKNSNKSGRRRPKNRREGGWVKKDRVWRSEKAQKTARGESGASRRDRELQQAAVAKTGPGGYKTYGDIPAHKLGRELRKRLYQIANRLPEDEQNNLKSRIKYAATTVTAALAQGFGEGAFRSGINHALESRGALVAIQDHLDHLMDQEMLTPEDGAQLKQEVDEVIRAVNDYLGRLTKERNRS